MNSVSDTAATMVAMQAASRANDLAIMMLKQQNDQAASVVDLLESATSASADTRSPPPPGQGGMVDRLA